MSGQQEGIVWKKMPNMAGGGGGAAAGDPSKDYSRFGARLQREIPALAAGSVIPVYDMPGDLLRVPTSLELQLFEPPLYLPEAPTSHTRLSSAVGRLHARIFYSIGNSGPLRIDCDWIGSVPIVAHKSLSVSVVADRFSAAPDPPASFGSAFTFSDSTDGGNPGTAAISFDTFLPEGGSPITIPPTTAYLSRESVSADDAADFTSTQTNQAMKLTVAYSTGDQLHFWVTSVVEHPDYLELLLGALISYSNVTTLDDGEAVTVNLAWDDAPTLTRIDVAVGLLVGSRAPAAPPTFTFPTTPIVADATAAFPVPAFARKLRCAFKYGDAPGSTPDAPLGQYFVAFMSRGFGSLAWIDGASAREALFGDGVSLPPGTHSVVVSNRSPEGMSVTPSFVLGI